MYEMRRSFMAGASYLAEPRPTGALQPPSSGRKSSHLEVPRVGSPPPSVSRSGSPRQQQQQSSNTQPPIIVLTPLPGVPED